MGLPTDHCWVNLIAASQMVSPGKTDNIINTLYRQLHHNHPSSECMAPLFKLNPVFNQSKADQHLPVHESICKSKQPPHPVIKHSDIYQHQYPNQNTHLTSVFLLFLGCCSWYQHASATVCLRCQTHGLLALDLVG